MSRVEAPSKERSANTSIAASRIRRGELSAALEEERTIHATLIIRSEDLTYPDRTIRIVHMASITLGGDVDHDLVRRASEIRPLLAEHAARTEAERQVVPEVM